MPEIIKLGRCTLDVNIRTLMMIDSLEMTEEDRELIVKHCKRCVDDQIVITHGTDTMVETAKTSSMVFIILLGAAMLIAAFRAFGGDQL